jgi:hypothetical protein
MVNGLLNKAKGNDAKRAESTPEPKPWREVGWIFKDGEVVAIEREGNETRVRRISD